MSARGTTVSGKAYTTSDTSIMSFTCPHTSKRGVVFFLYPTTVGTATISYVDVDGNERTMQTTACAADDLTTITFNFPISSVLLEYKGTSSGGTIDAEGRGH